MTYMMLMLLNTIDFLCSSINMCSGIARRRVRVLCWKFSFMSELSLVEFKHSHKYFIAFHITLWKTIFFSLIFFILIVHTQNSLWWWWGKHMQWAIVVFISLSLLLQKTAAFSFLCTSAMFCEMEKVSFFFSSFFWCYMFTASLCSLFYVERVISFRGYKWEI